MSFQNMGLMPELLNALKEKGYEEATPIQSQSIPRILLGGDVLGGAQTGTGKTAAFALPILQKLHKQRRRENSPRALILTPTRELAAQIQESFRDYGSGLNLRSTVIFGGVGIHPQIDRLRRGVDILVATPGRLLDHADRGTVDLSKVEVFVLDEADRMLDMGFIHDIRKVIRLVPEKRQSLLFSATYSNEIKALADKMLNKPELVEVAAENATADKVDQVIHPVARKRKKELLTQLITEGDWHQVLVFTRTKHGANRLSGQLSDDGISAMAIHGNKSQTARTQALADFKAGRVQVLVATDIAARGLDISMLPHVVNYELPDQAENYVHRIGRTGRAGQEGRAVSLVCPEEKKELQDIERLLRQSLPVEKIQGFERILPHEIGERPGRRGSGHQRPRGHSSEKRPVRSDSPRKYGSWQKDSDAPRSKDHGSSGRSGNQYGKRSNSRRKSSSSSSRNQNNRSRYS